MFFYLNVMQCSRRHARDMTTVHVEFRDAVRVAAGRTGLTIADYARQALSERMDRDGVSHPSLPSLSTSALPNLNGTFARGSFCTSARPARTSDEAS